MFEIIAQNYHLFLAGVSLVVWLTRLEGLVKSLEKEVSLIEKRQTTAIEQVAESLKRIAQKQEENAEKLQFLQLDVAKIVAFEEGRKSVRGRK